MQIPFLTQISLGIKDMAMRENLALLQKPNIEPNLNPQSLLQPPTQEPTISDGIIRRVDLERLLSELPTTITPGINEPDIESIPIQEQLPYTETLPISEQPDRIESIPITSQKPDIESIPITVTPPDIETIPMMEPQDTVMKQSIEDVDKPTQDLKGETGKIVAYRGEGKNIGVGVDLMGEGLYLTEPDVAKFYGDTVKTYNVEGKIYDTTKEFSGSELRKIAKAIDDVSGTNAGSEYLQAVIDYNDGKLPRQTGEDYQGMVQALATNNELYKILDKQGLLKNEFNPDSNFATLINKALEKIGYKGLKYSTDMVEDLTNAGLGGKNAYLIFSKDAAKLSQATSPTAKGGEIATISESLYHETGSYGLESLMAYSDATGLNVSTDKNFALGQGGKGILVELDKTKLLGDRGSLAPIKKPGTPIAGQNEFRLVGGNNAPGTIKSITIKEGTPVSKVQKAILNRDYNKVVNEDKSITFTPKLSPKEDK